MAGCISDSNTFRGAEERQQSSGGDEGEEREFLALPSSARVFSHGVGLREVGGRIFLSPFIGRSSERRQTKPDLTIPHRLPGSGGS